MSDIIFGAGVELVPEHPEPRIDVTQATVQDVMTVEQLEQMARDFPWSVKRIRSAILDKETYAVRVTLNFKNHGWCLYHIEEDHIRVDRLAIKNELFLPFVIEAIFKTITGVPMAKVNTPYRVTVVWPIHETDRFLFQHLLKDEQWEQGGTVADYDYAYGQFYDGVELSKVY